MKSRWTAFALAATSWLGLAAAATAAPTPTAFQARVMPLSNVDSVTLPALDRAAIAAEDAQDESRGLPVRFALPRKVNVTPDSAGTWESVDAHTKLWRYHIKSDDAASINVGFTKFWLPQGASLLLYSPDGSQVRGPVTAANNAPSRQFWTPVINGHEAVVELTIPSAEIAQLELEIGQIGQGYRGFGTTKNEKGGLPPDSSGACQMDVQCLLPADPWQDNVRAVAAYTINGTRYCTGSLVNNTAEDTKLYFMTANHCLSTQSAANGVVTYWNYNNTTCRVPGSTASGQNGDGPTDETISGSTLRATYSTSDFTLLELNGTVPLAFQQFWSGWDRTPYVSPGGPGNGDFACSSESLCAAIHHPQVADKRITFVADDTTTTSYNNPAIPGNGSHVHAFWDPSPIFPPDPKVSIPPQTTEPGSSGSPLYNAQRRYIGQLHGGPSACGSTGGNLSDYYGRFSVSWEGGGSASSRLKDWLDPSDTGAMFMDGRNACTAPSVPTNITATASGANEISVSWDTIAGADSYKLYRADGACPGTNWQLVAEGLTTPSYTDTAVSGNATYSYSVTSFSNGETCESAHSECTSATATGVCTLAPSFDGLVSAGSSASTTCGVDLAWNEGSNNCGGSGLKYHIFRSTTAGFTPDSSNQIASCQTGTSYHDGDVTDGTHYYYVARAEDDTANGSGTCNGGNVDTNLVEKAATPGGPPGPTGTDDMESGAGGWSATGTGGGADFALVTDQSHSPTHSWFVPDPSEVSDRTLTTANPLSITNGDSFTFWHYYDTEIGSGTTGYDGVVLEYSLDGETWSDILAAQGDIPANSSRFTAGGYNKTISSSFSSPIGGRDAWAGNSGGFVQTTVDMADFTGHIVWFRWRFASDQSVASTGYWLDDAPTASASSCSVDNDTIFADGFDG